LSLFKQIGGRVGEDVATEVIAYMLASEKDYVPFQKIFFHRVLGLLESSADLKTETTTQPSSENDRPDLIILTKDTLIILETKLGSYLSGNDQLIKYCELFKMPDFLKEYFPFYEPKDIKNRKLVFLAPRTTIELSITAGSIICQEKSGIDFISWTKQQAVDFMPLSWEEIVADLDHRDSLQNELMLFVNDYINQELTEEEKMILKNPEVPSAINKTINLIWEIRNHLASKDYSLGRLGQSYNSYGFMIEKKNVSFWFGYYLSLWGKYKTPVVLKLKEEWIKDNKNEIIDKIKELGFEKESASEFILPFSVDRVESWKQDLLESLSNF